MGDLILGDVGEGLIVVLGTAAAILCFVSFGRARTKYVQMNRIYLFSFGALAVGISAIYLGIIVNGEARPPAILNRIYVIILLILVIAIAAKIMLRKPDDRDT